VVVINLFDIAYMGCIKTHARQGMQPGWTKLHRPAPTRIPAPAHPCSPSHLAIGTVWVDTGCIQTWWHPLPLPLRRYCNATLHMQIPCNA
jgi:hypothetical protein